MADQPAIVGPVAADAGVVAVVDPDRAAVLVLAETPAVAHPRVAVIASLSTLRNAVRVALWRGPFACAWAGL